MVSGSLVGIWIWIYGLMVDKSVDLEESNMIQLYYLNGTSSCEERR